MLKCYLRLIQKSMILNVTYRCNILICYFYKIYAKQINNIINLKRSFIIFSLPKHRKHLSHYICEVSLVSIHSKTLKDDEESLQKKHQPCCLSLVLSHCHICVCKLLHKTIHWWLQYKSAAYVILFALRSNPIFKKIHLCLLDSVLGLVYSTWLVTIPLYFFLLSNALFQNRRKWSRTNAKPGQRELFT